MLRGTQQAVAAAVAAPKLLQCAAPLLMLLLSKRLSILIYV
jgi:hypothetical protein